MKTFRAKPIWTGTPDPLVAGQWTPAPHWATHILKNQHGSYAWAEKFDELYLGEPRYRSDVQSRDVFTIGPAAWQAVEARPANQRLQQALALLDKEYESLQKEAARRNSAYDHFGWDNTPEKLNSAVCSARELLQQELSAQLQQAGSKAPEAQR